jgi:hypothetical protein
MKLAVFACQNYYPDGGAGDFIGFAPNGTAEEVIALLRWARTEESDVPTFDIFNLLNCDTGEVTGARVDYRTNEPLEIDTRSCSTTIASRRIAVRSLWKHYNNSLILS